MNDDAPSEEPGVPRPDAADVAQVVGRGHRAAVRADDLVWVGSHASATRDVHSGARAAVSAIARALDDEGSAVEDLVRIGVYYDQSLGDTEVRRAIRAALPESARPVVNFLPVREPALPGAALVVDAATATGQRRTIGNADFPSAVRVGDGIWVRLVDVGKALSSRSYASENELVVDVVDSFCSWNEGRWKLAGGVCERTDDDADLRCDVSVLGSVYLGGFTFGELRRAQRVDELRPGAVDRADALFRRTGAGPWCPEIF